MTTITARKPAMRISIRRQNPSIARFNRCPPLSVANAKRRRMIRQGRLSKYWAIIEHGRSKLHGVAGARARSDARLLAREAADVHCAALAEDRHSARLGAPLPLHAGAARLRRQPGWAQLLAAAQSARPGPRLSVLHPDGGGGAALPRPRERGGERVVFARRARRRGHPLSRALGHLAHHLGDAQRRHPSAGALHLYRLWAAREPAAAGAGPVAGEGRAEAVHRAHAD